MHYIHSLNSLFKNVLYKQFANNLTNKQILNYFLCIQHTSICLLNYWM